MYSDARLLGGPPSSRPRSYLAASTSPWYRHPGPQHWRQVMSDRGSAFSVRWLACRGNCNVLRYLCAVHLRLIQLLQSFEGSRPRGFDGLGPKLREIPVVGEFKNQKHHEPRSRTFSASRVQSHMFCCTPLCSESNQ